MKIQQLKYIVEVCRHDLNLSAAAASLHTSQSGVSKQIRMLEEELGVQLFLRHGKRLQAVTAPGLELIKIARAILLEADNMQRVAADFVCDNSGSLVIATTHTQARYVLPSTVQSFLQEFPNVRLSIRQGSPTQICQMVLAGDADFAIATEAINLFPDLAMLDCYTWNRSIIVPRQHPLAHLGRPLALEDVAAHPVITYDFAFSGRSEINRAFDRHHLKPDVVLTALDTDVIKTYVALGLGVGIIASMAYDAARDQELQAIDASHLFSDSVTRIGLRKKVHLRHYAYRFICSFAPHLSIETIKAAVLAEQAF